MATEAQRATITTERGRQAAQIKDPAEKKAYIAGSAGVDTNYDSTAAATSTKGNQLQSQSILGSMHTGGPVMADGAYRLKAGEHVLTAAEAKKAQKHALMASGMKSLAKSGKSSSKKG
jgi:hypothetical protein